MAPSEDMIPQSWRFKCPLAYVLVDGKQIANGEVDLVVKCEAGKSPASASRHVEQPTVNRHKLMVYVPNEADPKVSLSLDGFLVPTATVTDPGSIRYSAQRRRLLINGSSRLSSRPIHDLRFSKGRDLLDTISRLNRIGLICADDDRDIAAVPESQTSAGSRSQTTSPVFVLSAEMMKAGRVMSPLQRRPDGSTPPFCLIQVPNSPRPPSALSTQESTSSQLSSQESQLMPPPRREQNFTSKSASVPVSAQRERSAAQLESIPPVLPLRASTSTISTIPERAPGPILRNGRASRRPAGGGKLQRIDSIADSEISSSQPAKRPRVSRLSGQKGDSQVEMASELPNSQVSLLQSQDISHKVDAFGESYQTQSTSQPESMVPDTQILADKQKESNAAMAAHFWKGNMQQTMVWEELRDALAIDVEAAEDDDEALESLVEKYQIDLSVRIGRSFTSYS